MKNRSGSTIADVLVCRHSFYDLLRRIFLWEIPPELFSELVEAAKGEQEQPDAECSHEAALKNALKKLSASDLSASYRDIQIEYTRLFLGPRHRPAPPYESVYRSPQKLMMQDVTMEVRSCYVKNGFQVTRINQMPDDMIGIELEFMCALSAASINAFLDQDTNKLARLLSTQREFCDSHLAKWVPQFCQDIANDTQADFWKSVAKSTETFIERDLGDLNRLLDLLEVPSESRLAVHGEACT